MKRGMNQEETAQRKGDNRHGIVTAAQLEMTNFLVKANGKD
jgi:hypothetical protein